jgi:hypothetical protein
MEEIPPSLLWFAEKVEVVFRATLVTSHLMGQHITRPANGAAFQLWARHHLLRRPHQLRKLVFP